MSEYTIVASRPPAASPPGRAPKSVRDRLSSAMRGGGDALIALGLAFLLSTAYEAWFTNIIAHHKQVKVSTALHQEWEQGIDPLPLPGSKVSTIPLGSGIAVLYLPRLGRDFHFAIVQGSVVPDDSQLEEGPAHYADTQLPGQVGNFAVAGHRVGKGEPFLNIDKMRSGDAVIVETKSWWYVYRVLGGPAGSNPQQARQQVATAADGSAIRLPGREIVDPSDGNVLQPVPDHPGAAATQPLMTMTACHPKFSSSHRMIVYSVLVTKVRNVDLTMPDTVQALYAGVKS